MTWEQADFDAAYQRDGQPSYRRNILGPDGPNPQWLTEQAQQWGLKVPGLANPASNVLVVGCGFGWMLETIRDTFNHDRIWGTDISAWIQSEKATHARADTAPLILDIDITAADAVRQFRTAGAGQQGKFDWVICELVTETIPAVDLSGWLDSLEGLLRPGGDVLHVVAAELDPAFGGRHDHSLGIRFRPLAEWVAESPAHYWLDIHTWTLSGGS